MISFDFYRSTSKETSYKAVVRFLPPTLTKDILLNSVQSYANKQTLHSWMFFRGIYSTATFDFISDEAMKVFIEKFNGHVFVTKGVAFKCQVEESLNQNGANANLLFGKGIEEDAEFQLFCIKLEKEKKEEETKNERAAILDILVERKPMRAPLVEEKKKKKKRKPKKPKERRLEEPISASVRIGSVVAEGPLWMPGANSTGSGPRILLRRGPQDQMQDNARVDTSKPTKVDLKEKGSNSSFATDITSGPRPNHLSFKLQPKPRGTYQRTSQAEIPSPYSDFENTDSRATNPVDPVSRPLSAGVRPCSPMGRSSFQRSNRSTSNSAREDSNSDTFSRGRGSFYKGKGSFSRSTPKSND